MSKSTGITKPQQRFGRTIVMAVSIMALLLLAGCGGTKVYNVDKTIVYKNSIYSVSDVKQLKATATGKLSDDKTVDLKGADRKRIEAYLKQYGPIYVRMSFNLDEEEVLYRATTVEKWSEYSRMQKDFEKAGKQIADLMAAKKTTQLKLR